MTGKKTAQALLPDGGNRQIPLLQDIYLPSSAPKPPRTRPKAPLQPPSKDPLYDPDSLDLFQDSLEDLKVAAVGPRSNDQNNHLQAENQLTQDLSSKLVLELNEIIEFLSPAPGKAKDQDI
ncbi:MAG: hypothetical protein ACO2ZD_04550 [Pseudomonadales bacterium]